MMTVSVFLPDQMPAAERKMPAAEHNLLCAVGLVFRMVSAFGQIQSINTCYD
jgi:hypothetical protein